MTKLLLLSALLLSSPAFALDVFNLNVFDQLQGKWDAGFRTRRLNAVANYIGVKQPQIVVFQEARGILPGEEGGGSESSDSALLRSVYTERNYIHEMTGADLGSYGYWMGAQMAPRGWINDGFSFEGGVARRVQAAVWDHALGPKDEDCLGILSLHMSYQTSAVRQVEARWILDWLRSHEKECKQWLVVGDFNADVPDREIQILFEGGLKPLYKEFKPTIGAFNPIRRIYGDNIPSKTIDWALGWNLTGTAEVVLDSPWNGEWVSDHAAVLIHLDERK
jgi:endonuclease/exonuclease/phosphatase family metal-dependent hydrolase